MLTNQKTTLSLYTWWLLAGIQATANAAAPNLTPYKPADWSDKIIVAKTTGTTTDDTDLTPTDTLYVDWAVINSGTSATSAKFYTELYVDGALKTSWYTDPAIECQRLGARP